MGDSLHLKWPVSVIRKDGGTIALFDALDAMQGALERVDIENGEYPQAFDASGRRLRLVPVGNYGVEVEIASVEADPTALRQALAIHLQLVAEAHQDSIPFDAASLSLDDLFALVAAAQ